MSQFINIILNHIIFIMDFYNDYNSEEEEEEDYSDIVYEPEEPSKTRFTIALCELYNDNIHGPGPEGHYLVNCRYKKLHIDWIMETADFIQNEYDHLHNKKHNLFPNYKKIIEQSNYIKPEIVECIYLQPDGESIAIIKTFWLKIIQRTWRNILIRRKEAFNCRQTMSSIRHREMLGKWPSNCYSFGGLQCMLKKM